MRIDEARAMLRDALLHLAQHAVPDAEPVVERDAGPIQLDVLLDEPEGRYSCHIKIVAQALEAFQNSVVPLQSIADSLAEDGWDLGSVVTDEAKHLLAARRDNFHVTVAVWRQTPVVYLIGDTPVYRRSPQPQPADA